jgi:hypothetical protein
MDNVTFINQEDGFGNEYIYALIAHTDGSFTSMLKSTYDAQQATLVSESSIPQAGE